MTPPGCPCAAIRPERYPNAAAPSAPTSPPDWCNWFGLVPPLDKATSGEWTDFYAMARALPQEGWLQIQAAGEATWTVRGRPITDLQHLSRYRGVPVSEYGAGTAYTFDDLAGVGGVPGAGKMAIRLDMLHANGSRNLVAHEAVHTWVNFVAPGWDRDDPGLLGLWHDSAAEGSLWDDQARNWVFEFAAEGMARCLHYRRYGGANGGYDSYSGLTPRQWDFFAATADGWGWRSLYP